MLIFVVICASKNQSFGKIIKWKFLSKNKKSLIDFSYETLSRLSYFFVTSSSRLTIFFASAVKSSTGFFMSAFISSIGSVISLVKSFVVFLNSVKVWPIAFPISGNFLGPKITKAIINLKWLHLDYNINRVNFIILNHWFY